MNSDQTTRRLVIFIFFNAKKTPFFIKKKDFYTTSIESISLYFCAIVPLMNFNLNTEVTRLLPFGPWSRIYAI